MTRERELAQRVQVEECGQRDHLHLVLYDHDGQAYADATIAVDAVPGFIEHLQKMLYALAALRDDEPCP